MFWNKWKRRGGVNRFKPVVLITGCASGIGLALAEMMEHQEGYRVVLTARANSLPVLQAKFKESDRLILRPLDVTAEEDRSKLVEEISALWGGVRDLV